MQNDWIREVHPFIQQRIERYSANEIRFNLLALIRDRREVYREQIGQLEAQRTDPAADSIGIDFTVSEYGFPHHFIHCMRLTVNRPGSLVM